MSTVVLVVPCFNERKRLDLAAFASLARSGPRLLFVDDGSTDGTAEALLALSRELPGHIEIVSLLENVGKAEAVRRGMLEALGSDAVLVGYTDADLSTPVEELLRLIGTAMDSSASAILGARVAMLGSEIRRSETRHYLGRIFATAASVVLGLRVYDTQCGAKLFRATPGLRAALSEPFLSRWAFDVELIGRLLAGQPGVAPMNVTELLEVPLKRWADAGDSRLSPGSMGRAAVDLVRIRSDLRRRRARCRDARRAAGRR